MADRFLILFGVFLLLGCSYVQSQCPYANQNTQGSAYYSGFKLPYPYDQIATEQQQQSGNTMAKIVRPLVHTVSPITTNELASNVVAPIHIKATAVEASPVNPSYTSSSYSNYGYQPMQRILPAPLPIPATTSCGQVATAPVYSTPPQQQIAGLVSSQPVNPTSPCSQSRLIQPSCGGCSSCGGGLPCGSYPINYKK